MRKFIGLYVNYRKFKLYKFISYQHKSGQACPDVNNVILSISSVINKQLYVVLKYTLCNSYQV